MKSIRLLPKPQRNKIFITLYLLAILVGLVKTYFDETRTVNAFAMPVGGKVILIDPGHGGFDPGMVSADGSEEKAYNLQIAKKLQAYLEQSGACVFVTRADDSATANEKRADMRSRTKMADELECDLLVSIHQNSYPNAQAKGAQVFYYQDSEKSEFLAECIQEGIASFADPSNKRLIKPNANYYMLKRTKQPSVIVECGFLSNPQEREKLKGSDYQERIAWSIYMGIVHYFDE